LRKAEVTAISLECRAFGYSRERTYVKDVYFKASDVILVVLTLIVSALLIYWEKM
jgi:energy-coupling factor transporter transmembrane protein EcfT